MLNRDIPRAKRASLLSGLNGKISARRGRINRMGGCLFLFWFALLAARGEIRFDVFVGYDGIVPASSWYPVTCEVVNDGPTFDAVFEIHSGRFNQEDTRRLALELPTGTLKRFVLPMHAPRAYTYSLDARLLDRRGQVRAESLGIRVRQQAHWQIPLLGALTRSAPTFPEIKVRGNLQPVVARLLPQLFPDNPLALQGLDTIYLTSERALDLKEAQAEALRIWLYGGGHLVLGVEQRIQVQGTEWLEKMMPCSLSGSQSMTNHSALHEWLVSDLDITGQKLSPGLREGRQRSQPSQANRKPVDFSNPYATLPVDTSFESKPLQTQTMELGDGRVLVGTDAQPLMVAAGRGLGRLTVLLFSPELEPFLSWSNRSHFWAKVCDLPPELLGGTTINPSYNEQSLDGVFGAMIETEQVRKLPVGWLLLLLLTYLIVIGPFDRFWLKKIKRPMLTWLTFPVYVVFFSLLIYFIGYKLRAGETEWSELHLVDVVGGNRSVDLYGRTYGAIYSPANARYTFSSSEPFAVLRPEYAAAETGLGIFEQRGNSFMARIPVSVWTSRLLVCDWWRPDVAPILAQLEGEGSRRILRVENRLDQPCRNLQFVLEGQLYKLGALETGATLTFDLGSQTSQPLSYFVGHWHAEFQQALAARRRAFGRTTPSRIRDLGNAAVAASYYNRIESGQLIIPPGLDPAPPFEGGEGILLAWTEGFSPTKALNEFKPRRGNRNTLWRVHVPSRPPTTK